MKKLLFVLLILSVATSYAQVPSYVPTNGLVAYYPFNGNANDVSGNGNNGTLNGGVTFQNDRFGNQSKSCNFNGDGFVEIPSLLNIQYNPTTYSAWIRANSLVTDIRPLGSAVSIVGRDLCGQGIQGQLVVWHNPNVSINQQLDFYTGNSGVAFNYSVPLNQWIHVVFSWDQNDTMKLYVNGQLIQSTYSSSSGFLSNGMPPFRIGSGAGNCTTNSIGRFFWKGDIDDVTIYNRALSPQEITQLYTGQVIPSYVPTNGLVGYWPFNGNALDESGNGNNGTVNGATLTTDRFGNVGKAYSFDGVSNYIEVPSSNSICLTTSYTISVWLKAAVWSFQSPIDQHAIVSKIVDGDWYGGYEIRSSVTYTAIVGAPTTSQTPTSVFRWTRPNNTTVTAASADSSSITVRFNTGYVGGTLSVRGQSRCGTLGITKSQALTHTGCAVGTKLSVPVTTETNINSFEVSLYPNPSAGEFKLLINLVGGKTPTMGAKAAAKAIVKVIDLQGRLIKSFECNANQPTAIGNELKPGVYMVEVRMGDEVKTVRAVRF